MIKLDSMNSNMRLILRCPACDRVPPWQARSQFRALVLIRCLAVGLSSESMVCSPVAHQGGEPLAPAVVRVFFHPSARFLLTLKRVSSSCSCLVRFPPKASEPPTPAGYWPGFFFAWCFGYNQVSPGPQSSHHAH